MITDQDKLNYIYEKIKKLDKIEEDIENLKIEIKNQDFRINLLAEQKQNTPTTFLEALSSSSLIGAPKRFINPAYKE